MVINLKEKDFDQLVSWVKNEPVSASNKIIRLQSQVDFYLNESNRILNTYFKFKGNSIIHQSTKEQTLNANINEVNTKAKRGIII